MTLPLRRVVFWAHLIAGVTAAVVILLMSVTGVLLAYEKQMIRWADGHHAPPASPGQARLPLEDIVERARAARPEPAPATVLVRREVAAPVEVSYGREGSLFLNAYTGEVLGSGSARTRAFFRATMEWHRWLAMKDGNRALGKQITGVSNLVFLFIVVSGFYLWWPRTWRWSQFRQVLLFRRGLGGKARDFNWHHVIGYWSLVPLAVIVWSGVVIGYPWASDLTYRMVGEAPPAAPARPAGGAAGRADGGPKAGAAREAVAAGAANAPGSTRTDVSGNAEKGGARNAETGGVELDASARRPYQPLGVLMAKAQQQASDWTILSLRVPSPRDPSVQFTVDTGTGAQPQKKGTLVLDRVSGDATRWEPFEAQSPGRQWRSWMRFVHTGEYYGLVGQTIAMVVTAGSVVLVWTGLALTWRRFVAWRRRSSPGHHVRNAA